MIGTGIAIRANSWLLWMFPNAMLVMVYFIMLLVIGTAGFVVIAIMEKNPIRSVSIVSVLPEDHVLDRTTNPFLQVTRNVCSDKRVRVRVTREWIDSGSGIQPVLDDWTEIAGPTPDHPDGCEVRNTVNVFPPTNLNPGIHHYRVGLEWCNKLRQCEVIHLEPIEIKLIGNPPIPERKPDLGGRF